MKIMKILWQIIVWKNEDKKTDWVHPFKPLERTIMIFVKMYGFKINVIVIKITITSFSWNNFVESSILYLVIQKRVSGQSNLSYHVVNFHETSELFIAFHTIVTLLTENYIIFNLISLDLDMCY